MIRPSGLADTLAGLMLVTSGYCVARLVAARAWKRTLNRDTNIAHTADGVAMAGMLVGALRTLPDGAWEVVFAALTIWFAGRGGRFLVRHGLAGFTGDAIHDLSHYASHLTMSGAMFYMFIEASPSGTGATTGAMSAMGGAGATSNLTELTLFLVVVLFASAVWHADGLTRYTTAAPALVTAAAPAGFGGGVPAATTTVAAQPTARHDTGIDQSRWLAPRLEMACHIALCITMGFMLILML